MIKRLFSLVFLILLIHISLSSALAINGDANRDGKVDGIDYVIWLNNYNRSVTEGAFKGDFNGNGFVDGLDYVVWLNNYGKSSSVTPSPTSSVLPTQPQTGELSIAVCDPSNGPFSLNITNAFMPLPVGKQLILENATFKVQLTVLNETEIVAGVTTRVFEEKEWENGNLIEISRNFAVQAPDGTVCYYGEDVDMYTNGVITAHTGAWRAGIGPNKPGILMPAHPSVGQTYYQEVAPGVAEDRAEHISMGGTFTTPAGTFNDVMFVRETPPSDKRYQPGIGMIYDDSIVLTSYR